MWQRGCVGGVARCARRTRHISCWGGAEGGERRWGRAMDAVVLAAARGIGAASVGCRVTIRIPIQHSM